MSIIESGRLRDLVGAVPPGAWMSYGDVARACGGTDVHARTLNQRFQREEIEGAHRVLKHDGTVGGTALGDPAACGAAWRPRAWSSTAARPRRGRACGHRT